MNNLTANLFFTMLLACAFLPGRTLQGQSYHERLFHTAKVWGFVKYFHSETANGSINLDSILVQKLPEIELAATPDAFNQILLEMITSPGETALPTIPMPVIPDSLMYNLNLEWIQDPLFSSQVRDALDTIRVRFRPRTHCLVGQAFINGNPTFDEDILYNNAQVTYPEKEIRLLSLFRYWNILNYFFPYKNIMDQDWDSTLTEVIPLFADATTAIEYDKAIMVLAKRINDSHAYTTGGVVNSILGLYYPRFSIGFIENQPVVMKVSSSLSGIKPGDIVRSMDSVEMNTYQDSLWEYTWGSNDEAIMHFVLDDILRGPSGAFPVTVENETGLHDYLLQRNWSSYTFSTFQQNAGPIWYDTTVAESCSFGYVDMGRLTTDQVEPMMNDLWETDAIVFDIRNYPQGTLWELVSYLFTHPIPIASFTVPNPQYPGVLSWMDAYVGGYSANVYQGKLIILFDIRTISQAEYTCMGLEQHPGAVKIGSQTLAADGNVSLVYLPGNVITYFTGLGTFYPDYTPTQRIGIVPDIEVLPTIAGIRAGRDEVLECAFDCSLVAIKESTAQEGSLVIRPNPFYHTAWFDVSLQESSHVRVTIHDGRGSLVRVVTDTFLMNGDHSIPVDMAELPAGIYYSRFILGNQVVVKKLIKVL